jgi:hypothetical protein
MAEPLFMNLRRGTTLRIIEDPEGDTSGLDGNPTAWIVEADARAQGPLAGATPIALTVVLDGDRWIMTLLDTDDLTASRYLFYSRYVMDDASVYIPEPTLLVVKS